MIPFNQPYLTGKEIDYISEAHARGQLAGDGYFTKKCNVWLEEMTGCHKALLTHSCTAALKWLQFWQIFSQVMRSHGFTTFAFTANAFVLRGGVPACVDIREDTLNIDERLIEDAITPRTKAIVPVHYAGGLRDGYDHGYCSRLQTPCIEDAARGVMAIYKGVCDYYDFGCYSFHETKNIISGEGGALLIILRFCRSC